MKENEAIEWIAEIFEESVENIKPETQKDEIPAWDSLGVLNLMAAFDEEFDILLTEEEITELLKVGDILVILKQYDKLK